MSTIEELDAELAASHEWLRKLKKDTIAELNEFLEGETNPYIREFLLQQLEKVRAKPVP